MANENTGRQQHVIHQMLNVIKKAEIENAKTMRYSDKEMVTKLSSYILDCAKKQIASEDSSTERKGDRQ